MNYINDVSLQHPTKPDCFNVVIEICPGTSNKHELQSPGFNTLVCVRKVIGEYPFYYGSFPQTLAGDNDPLDFILFTDIDHKQLDLVQVDVIGAVKTIDAGEQDDKIICVECSSSLMNLKKHMKKALKFLKNYKGKDADMEMSKRLASMSEATKLVLEAHEAWKQSRKTNVQTERVVNTSRANTRIQVVRG